MKGRPHDNTYFMTVTVWCIAGVFLLILLYTIVVVIVVFSFCVGCLLCVCSFVCCVSFDRCVILCDVCYLCLTVVPLPPGENPFAVKIIIIIIMRRAAGKPGYWSPRIRSFPRQPISEAIAQQYKTVSRQRRETHLGNNWMEAIAIQRIVEAFPSQPWK
jgi:hypothetical protein